MKVIIEKLCLDVVVTALLSIVLGLVFFLYPVDTVDTITRVIAVVIFIFGVALVGTGMVARSGFSITTAMGIFITAMGIWTFIKPNGILGVIPFFIGLLILCHGLLGAKAAVDAGRCKLESWWVLFGLAVVTIVVGVVTILNAFDIVILTAKIVGLFLIYDGISGLIVVIRARLAIRRYERTMKENEPVEVVATVVDESEDTEEVKSIEG